MGWLYNAINIISIPVTTTSVEKKHAHIPSLLLVRWYCFLTQANLVILLTSSEKLNSSIEKLLINGSLK